MREEHIVRPIVEEFARVLDRRTVLRRAAQAGFATAVALASGSFAAVSRVLADTTCSCSFPFGRSCGSLGYTCQSSGACSTRCDVCTSGSGGTCTCGYSAGWWYSCGCGGCGMGCHKCYDCICPPAGGCSALCGCRSSTCFCCNCCSPQDVAEELQRLGAAA